MSTHKIGFYGEISKIIPYLSPNTCTLLNCSIDQRVLFTHLSSSYTFGCSSLLNFIRLHHLTSLKKYMSHLVTKPTKWPVCPVNTQISLGIPQSLLSTWRNDIPPVWSESLLSTWRNTVASATHLAHSKDSDQTGRMPYLADAQADLSLRWVHIFSWFCHEAAHIQSFLHVHRAIWCNTNWATSWENLMPYWNNNGTAQPALTKLVVRSQCLFITQPMCYIFFLNKSELYSSFKLLILFCQSDVNSLILNLSSEIHNTWTIEHWHMYFRKS